MKNLFITFSLLFSLNSLATTVPNVFSSGDKVTVEKVNENFEKNRIKIAYVEERYPHDSNFSSLGTSRVVTLNSLKGDTTFVSLVSGDFLLEAGTYDITGYCSIRVSGNYSCGIRKNTGGEVVMPGSPSYSPSDSQRTSQIQGLLTLTEDTQLEVILKTDSTMAHDANQYLNGDEIYTSLRIQKLD